MKYYLGLDVGGTNLAAGIVTEDYKIIARANAPSGAARSIEEITKSMGDVSKQALAQAGLTINDIGYWGIGMPSCINPKTDLLVHANCFGWRNVPIKKYLKKQMDIPILVENDANCAAYGEVLEGAGKKYSNVVVLTLGTGVGGGIILNNKIYAGADGMGGELGHTKLVLNGKKCTCGKLGCMEAYCSARALKEMAVNAMMEDACKSSILWSMVKTEAERITPKDVVEGAKAGDTLSGKVFHEYVDNLAAGIATFITIFRPDAIVLGGGVSNAGEFLLTPLRKAMRKQTFAAEEIGIPEVLCAKLGNDAGIIGAAMLGKMSE